MMAELSVLSPRDLGIPRCLALPKRKDWRIGLVGFGGIAEVHASAYRNAGWSIVAIADTCPEARERGRQATGCARVYSDYEDLIADSEVEVVSLLTQPTLREPVVRAALEAGKPIQTEKPMGLDIAECERMVRLSERSGVRFAVNQNYRWMPSNFAAHHLIQKGYIGKPYLASIEIQGNQDAFFGSHPFYAQCPDFLTIQWNTHLADLLRFWTGRDPKRVFARSGRMTGQSFKSNNLLLSLVDFGEGLTGHILHNELVRGALIESRCRIDGDGGSVLFSLLGTEMQVCSKQLGEKPFLLDLKNPGWGSPFAGPMADLLLSIEEGREPLLSGKRNLPTIRQVLAEHQSAQAGGIWINL